MFTKTTVCRTHGCSLSKMDLGDQIDLLDSFETKGVEDNQYILTFHLSKLIETLSGLLLLSVYIY